MPVEQVSTHFADGGGKNEPGTTLLPPTGTTQGLESPDRRGFHIPWIRRNGREKGPDRRILLPDWVSQLRLNSLTLI